MTLNDLGRKGVRAVIVTKKEGEAPWDEGDTYITINRDPKLNPPAGEPMTVEVIKPRPPSGDGRLVMRYTPPTALGVVSGTGIDTTNLVSDK